MFSCASHVSKDKVYENKKIKQLSRDIDTTIGRNTELKRLYWVIDAEIENMDRHRKMDYEVHLIIATLYRGQISILTTLNNR